MKYKPLNQLDIIDLTLDYENKRLSGQPFNHSVTIYVEKLHRKEAGDNINVIIKDCVFYNNLTFLADLSDLVDEDATITFNSCVIEDFDLHNSIKNPKNKDIDITIRFIDCFINKLGISQIDIERLEFSNCITKDLQVTISEISFINIRNTVGYLTLFENFNSYISITQNEFALKQIFKKFEKDEIFLPENITTSSLIGGFISLYIHSRETYKHHIDEKKSDTYRNLKKFNIKSSIDLETYLNEKFNTVHIEEIPIEKLEFKGKSKSDITIKNINIQKLIFRDFLPEQMILFNIKPLNSKKSSFNSYHSDLSTSRFNKVHFEKFNRVNFYQSVILNTIFSSTNFPVNIYAAPEGGEISGVKDEYENYRQLKYALANQADQVGALEMHQKMYDAIHSSKKGVCWFKDSNKFILDLNKFSNNHGVSVGKPLLLILIFNFIVLPSVLPFTFSSLPYEFGWVSFDSFIIAIKQTSLSVISYFFSEENIKVITIMLNPVHRVSTIENTLSDNHTLSSFSYVISFLARIINAWLFYQFVAAFRKFGKKL